MTVSPRNRMLLLGSALVLTLVAGFSLDKGDQIGQFPSKVKNVRAAKADFVPASGRSDEVPTIALSRKPPAEEMSDVFRSTSWYVPPPPPEPAPPAPPPLPFTYIGMMQEGMGKVVFLAKQDNSYAIRKGDVLDGTYRVEEIKESEVVLTYLPLNMKQSMSIGGRN